MTELIPSPPEAECGLSSFSGRELQILVDPPFTLTQPGPWTGVKKLIQWGSGWQQDLTSQEMAGQGSSRAAGPGWPTATLAEQSPRAFSVGPGEEAPFTPSLPWLIRPAEALGRN